MGCLLLLICFKLEMRQTFYLCCSKEINGRASFRLLPFLGSAHPRVFGVTQMAFFLAAVAAGFFFLHVSLIFCICLMFLPSNQLFMYWIWLVVLSCCSIKWNNVGMAAPERLSQ